MFFIFEQDRRLFCGEWLRSQGAVALKIRNSNVCEPMFVAERNNWFSRPSLPIMLFDLQEEAIDAFVLVQVVGPKLSML